MFESARLKLTVWYLLIILLVSGMFSFAFYRASTQEIQRVIDRIEYQQSQQDLIFYYALPPGPVITLEELQEVKIRLQIVLIIVNGIIVVMAGGAGYFLAGRTLRPIQLMLEEQNQFISNASHELRTPIATLRAEMEGSLLEKHVSDKEARKLIASNLEELSRLQELSNNLLQLAYVADNHHQLTELVSLYDVVTSAEKKVLPMLKKKQIKINFISFSGTIRGDKQSLIEVFVNLFDNAIKYSAEKTEITVSVTTKKQSIHIAVSDHGIGIDAKDVFHIFDRFYRADKSRARDGYGLGLAIVKKIISIHKGTITVSSKVGVGTTFVIALPLA